MPSSEGPRRSTRARKPKLDPEFLFEDFSFPPSNDSTRPVESAASHDNKSSPGPQGDQPSPLEQQLALVKLEKEKLELEVQALHLRQQGVADPMATGPGTSGQTTKKRHVDWPHQFIPGMSNNLEFEKLDIAEFFAGYLAMIKPHDPDLKAAMSLRLELLATSY